MTAADMPPLLGELLLLLTQGITLWGKGDKEDALPCFTGKAAERAQTASAPLEGYTN